MLIKNIVIISVHTYSFYSKISITQSLEYCNIIKSVMLIYINLVYYVIKFIKR